MNKQADLLKTLIKHRRYLHANPELGRQEFKTQAYIIAQIEKLGLKYKTLNTSTICDLIVNPEYEMIALRADIDALAITETNDCEYRSLNEGVMHACGHDGHTAIQLGVIQYLTENKADLRTNIRFIFQCDEEGDGGAQDLCQAGYLQGIKQIFGLHLDNGYPVGSIAYKYGQVNAGGDELKITVTGKQAHGAYPHLGSDSIVCSANIINHATQVIARNINPLDSSVITIGTIHGAGTANTICGEVVMEATIRNLKAETRTFVVDKFINDCQYIAKANNCTINIEHSPSYPPLINHQNEVDIVVNSATKLNYRVNVKEQASMGLEDFAYYVEQIPGAFFNVGSCLAEDYRNAHSSSFDFDEQALLVGAEIQIKNCLSVGREDER